jgi:hypothetical protein
MILRYNDNASEESTKSLPEFVGSDSELHAKNKYSIKKVPVLRRWSRKEPHHFCGPGDGSAT